MKKYILAFLFATGFAASAFAAIGDPEACQQKCMEARKVCLQEGSSKSYCDSYYRRCQAACGALQ